uniref:RING-type domain-containing protein n=3 Tax=Cuerna arida TaxID=1464854 RepID=A0A1B6FST2_9HEMI
MESLLAEECARKEKFLAYEKIRAEVVQNSLSREVEWGEQVSELLSARDTRQSALVSAVEADTEVQKALVATLLERSDLRTRSLVIQVALVEQQLAVLTAVEMQRRNMDYVHHVNDLAEKRKTLSELLVELLREQKDRHRHLVDTLRQLDRDRGEESGPDYWLQQYQHLLDTRPHQLTSALDPDLIHELVLAGVTHCLPFLTCCQIVSLTSQELSEIGVTNEEDRTAIMKAVNAYLRHKQPQAQPSPSAPPLVDEPSAPPWPTSEALPECVVCMEFQCAVVFVPCGHLCTCTVCATRLGVCPLCRATVERKIHVIMP